MQEVILMNAKSILSLLSYKQLRMLGKILPEKYLDFITRMGISKFVNSKAFLEYSAKGKELRKIQQGEFPFPLFQIYFMESMISLCIYCMYHDCVPIIDFISNDGVNLWNQFLEQPFDSSNTADSSNVKPCDTCIPMFSFPLFPTDKDVKAIHEIYNRFLKFNSTATTYFNNEYLSIISDKKVLGVLCRGTDYTHNKPKGHPVQPSIQDLISKVRCELINQDCDYIYLATEESRIMELFNKEFPNIVLTNTRHYYDEFYTFAKNAGADARISWVHHERENDNYWKSLEYMSSINILSKCKALVAGNCGGSRAALYLNGGKYTYWYLFNLGVY